MAKGAAGVKDRGQKSDVSRLRLKLRRAREVGRRGASEIKSENRNEGKDKGREISPKGCSYLDNIYGKHALDYVSCVRKERESIPHISRTSAAVF